MTHPHGQQQQYMYGIYRKEAFAIFDLHRCRCIDFQKLSLLVHHRSTITVSPLNVSCNISPSLIKSYLQARGGNSKGDQYVTHTDLLRDPPSLFLKLFQQLRPFLSPRCLSCLPCCVSLSETNNHSAICRQQSGHLKKLVISEDNLHRVPGKETARTFTDR